MAIEKKPESQMGNGNEMHLTSNVRISKKGVVENMVGGAKYLAKKARELLAIANAGVT